jgi:hypothetical protein
MYYITDHSPRFSAEVKNAQSYTSTPQYAFMAWCSVKVQGQLYLLLVTDESTDITSIAQMCIFAHGINTMLSEEFVNLHSKQGQTKI